MRYPHMRFSTANSISENVNRLVWSDIVLSVFNDITKYTVLITSVSRLNHRSEQSFFN